VEIRNSNPSTLLRTSIETRNNIKIKIFKIQNNVLNL
jgi:hypothetical protein